MFLKGFYTSAGSATPGQDYVSKDSLLFFEEFSRHQTVQVEILDYDGKEDQEFFTVHLSDAEGGAARVCDNGVSTVYIEDVVIAESKLIVTNQNRQLNIKKKNYQNWGQTSEFLFRKSPFVTFVTTVNHINRRFNLVSSFNYYFSVHHVRT